MKKHLIRAFILVFIFCIHKIYSQSFMEQNSGVTMNLTSVSMNPGNSYSNVWVCGYGGTVINTSNSGSTWVHVINNGIPNTVNLVNISDIDANNALTAGYQGTNTYVYRTSNGGGTFSQVFTQANGYINAIWMKNATTGFIEGNPVGGRWSLWKTSDGGNSWDSTGLYLPQAGTETGWNNSLCIVGTRIWFGTNNTRIYFSSNFGTSWQALSTSPEVNSYAVSFYYADSVSGYFGGVNSYKTTNRGFNWTALTCPGTGNFGAFTFGNLEGVPQPYIDFAIRNDSNIYSNSMMSSWITRYSAPAGVYRHSAYSFSIFTQYTWAVRSNGGITRFWIFFGEVKKISSSIPDKFSLYQNYPNPFNPSTRIKFDITPLSNEIGEGQGVRNVTHNIYDILGREVATLVNEKLQAGTYEVEFDGTNFASGIYFYKLTAGDFTQTRKMVLLK